MRWSEILENLRNYREVRVLKTELNQMFNKRGLFIKFSDHFIQRLMQRRIEENDVKYTFSKFSKYVPKITKPGYHGMIFDEETYLNIPFRVTKRDDEQYSMILFTSVKDKKQLKPQLTDSEILKV